MHSHLLFSSRVHPFCPMIPLPLHLTLIFVIQETDEGEPAGLIANQKIQTLPSRLCSYRVSYTGRCNHCCCCPGLFHSDQTEVQHFIFFSLRFPDQRPSSHQFKNSFSHNCLGEVTALLSRQPIVRYLHTTTSWVGICKLTTIFCYQRSAYPNSWTPPRISQLTVLTGTRRYTHLSE